MNREQALKIRDRIRGNFDRAAGSYRRFEEETAHFGRLVGELLGMAPPLAGGRVLDVGCGTGASTAQLLAAVGPAGRVVGIDISLGMLGEARRRHPEAAFALVDGCDFAAGLRGRFDAVVYNAVLFMLPSAEQSLESARRVLVPGRGVVLATLLEEARVAGGGPSVPEALAARGWPVGRHAVSAWERIGPALEQRFRRVSSRFWPVRLPPQRFAAFYGLEPMSAGLMPKVPYPERRRAVEALAAEWAAEGVEVEQLWRLVCASGPAGSGRDRG